MNRIHLTLLLALSGLLGACETGERTSAIDPIEVRIVLVTMFERGADTGDAPGEFQLWYERRHLDQMFPFQGEHDLHYNPDSGILAIVTGAGTAKAASSIMALGMDPRFDLTKSYWLVAGIAGFDPADASVGSAAWAEYLVDGDLSHEIDAREKPADWEWGYIARHTKVPFDPDRPAPRGEVFRANGALAEWAYQLTRDIDLPDDPVVARERERYVDHPNARRPPFVLRGDNIAALTFWHGEILNGWANAWVDYWSGGNGEFVSSAMEETGTFQSLTYLDRIGRVDIDRAMVLRTASNFTIPPPGVSAAENLLRENEGYTGLDLAVESAYRVGSAVIDELLGNWSVYRERIPGPAVQPVAIMTFNVENLFDNVDDPGKDDLDFLPLAAKQTDEHRAACARVDVASWRDRCLSFDWSDEALERKLRVVADAILQVGDGRGPDILALQEVENIDILERLRSEYLSAADYLPGILVEGDDARGIDVAFLSRLPPAAPPVLHAVAQDETMKAREGDTRGILQADFRMPDGSVLTGFAVHFPAPYHPTAMRVAAYETLSGLAASLPADRNVFAAGDFNTTSAEDAREHLLDRYARPGWVVSNDACDGCQGTSYYAPDDAWSFLDMILWRPCCGDSATWDLRAGTVRVANRTAAQVTEAHTPRRFDDPPGTGVSDHWPVVLTLEPAAKQ